MQPPLERDLNKPEDLTVEAELVLFLPHIFNVQLTNLLNAQIPTKPEVDGTLLRGEL